MTQRPGTEGGLVLRVMLWNFHIRVNRQRYPSAFSSQRRAVCDDAAVFSLALVGEAVRFVLQDRAQTELHEPRTRPATGVARRAPGPARESVSAASEASSRYRPALTHVASGICDRLGP